MENRWQMVDNFGLWGNDPFSNKISVNEQPKQKIDADTGDIPIADFIEPWDLE